MLSYKSESEDWAAFQQEETRLEQHIQNFDKKLSEANIVGVDKLIMMRNYINDVAQNCGYKVI